MTLQSKDAEAERDEVTRQRSQDYLVSSQDGLRTKPVAGHPLNHGVAPPPCVPHTGAAPVACLSQPAQDSRGDFRQPPPFILRVDVMRAGGRGHCVFPPPEPQDLLARRLTCTAARCWGPWGPLDLHPSAGQCGLPPSLVAGVLCNYQGASYPKGGNQAGLLRWKRVKVML